MKAGVSSLDVLLQKYNDYMRLKDCRAEYKLVNGEYINVTYKEENFAHLIGLHKLKDIQLIQFLQDNNNKKVKLKEVNQVSFILISKTGMNAFLMKILRL